MAKKEYMYGEDGKPEVSSRRKYEDIYKTAARENEGVALTVPTYDWQSEGQLMVGKLVGIKTIKSAVGDGSYNWYTLETDDGLVQTSLGAVADSVITEGHIGRVLALTYKGKKNLDGGRTLNQYEILDLGEKG